MSDRKSVSSILTAARTLGGFTYEELKEIIDEIHFKVFGKTLQERNFSC